MFSTCTLALALTGCAVLQSEPSAKDLRAELPRDVRIVLLGVPSVKNARTAWDNLSKALDDLDAEFAEAGSPSRIEQLKLKLYFRMGQLDDSLASLTQTLREQEKIKGLESYRDFARALELHSQSFGGLAGTSDTPLVSEDDAPPSNPTPASATELAKQLRVQLNELDRLLVQIEHKAKPDQERKAQLEKDVGAVSQFVFQIRGLSEDIRAAEAGQPVRVDSGEIVRGVQGLIDTIRELKREKELKSQPAPREPLPPKRDRLRL
jgi:hypothetical protein